MNRKILIVIVLVAVAALGGLGWKYLAADRPEQWLGYVEGETLYFAAPVSGTLGARNAERGDTVKPGQTLFTLNPVTTDAETARLQAQVDAARAQLADLAEQRQRPPELDVTRASQEAARAQLVKTQKDYERIAALSAKGFVSRTQLDSAKAARDVAQATLAQTQAQERSGTMTNGRAEQVRAAAANLASAESVLRAQQQRRSEISPVSPAQGIVEQTFFDPGEWVPANAPVLSVLPDDKRKLRFFVPENRIATISVGRRIGFSCDGCGNQHVAVIRYIAPRAEFTPPVIYSEHAKAKLVFMVEAALAPSARPLPLGLPVTVYPVADR